MSANSANPLFNRIGAMVSNVTIKQILELDETGHQVLDIAKKLRVAKWVVQLVLWAKSHA